MEIVDPGFDFERRKNSIFHRVVSWSWKICSKGQSSISLKKNWNFLFAFWTILLHTRGCKSNNNRTWKKRQQREHKAKILAGLVWVSKWVSKFVCVFYADSTQITNTPVKDEVVVCIYRECSKRMNGGNKAKEEKKRPKKEYIDYTDTTWWKRFFFALCTYVFIYSFIYRVWRMGSSREKWQLNIVVYLWHIPLGERQSMSSTHTWTMAEKLSMCWMWNGPPADYNVHIVWWWCWWRWFFCFFQNWCWVWCSNCGPLFLGCTNNRSERKREKRPLKIEKMNENTIE